MQCPRFLAGDTKPSAVVVTLVDITDRVRAEEVVRETNERFQLAFHASPVSVVNQRPHDGVYVDVNQAALETFGYARDEVVGRSVLTMNLWTNPDDRQEIVAILLAEGEVNRREVLLRHKGRSPVKCLVSLRLISLRGGEAPALRVGGRDAAPRVGGAGAPVTEAGGRGQAGWWRRS